MSQPDAGTAGKGTARDDSERGRASGSRVVRYVRRAMDSGALAGVAGGASLLGGVRALRRGDRRHGIVRLLVGGLLVGAAVRQRRSRGAGTGERAGFAEPSTDEAAAGEEPERVPKYEASLADRTEAAEAGGDAEAVAGTAAEAESSEAESVERLGEAAFDEYSSEVPVPQRAFNREFLALDAEAFWGVREADDAVVVSQLFDPIDRGEGMRYVASSQVDGERMLSIPNAVRNHWDAVAGGGTAVVGGDDIVFATTERLAADGLLLVVPEGTSDDVLGESE